MSDKVPMKIVVVEPRGSGGMIHYAYQLCNALSACVSEVKLITSKQYELDTFPAQFHLIKLLNLWSTEGNKSAEKEQNRFYKYGWKIYRSLRRAVRGLRLIFGWMQLIRYLLKERPDIVQFGEIEFPFEAVFLQYLKSQGLFLTQVCHEFEPREIADSILVKLNNRLLKNVFSAFSVMFFHSQSNLNRFRDLYPEIPPERFHISIHGNESIFPSFVDQAPTRDEMMARYQISSTERVILFFGNISPSKGVPVLLEAFRDVHEQARCARLVVAGMPLKYIDINDLHEMASNLGIQSATIFDTRYIPMEEVGPLMGLATVVVFPYLSATQSGSIQVSYRFGKPVIATKVGGLPDVVIEGQSGLLVEPNSPKQLSTAILRVIEDDELAKRMGRKAKELSDTHFAWEPIARNIVEVYQNARARGSKNGPSN